MREDAELVVAARTDDPDAFAELVDRWLDRCWEIAWRILHDRDLAADVAQDTMLAAWQQLDRLAEPASFGGWVRRIARNRALDRLQRERRAVPTDDEVTLEPRPGEAPPLADPVVALDRAERGDLVWAAAAALGERDASLLDLHLRHGLEPHELADELGVAPNAAHQALFRLRARLGDAVRAWLLWNHGQPGCVTLAAELAVAGIDTFGKATVRLVSRHVGSCVACADERERVTAPAALFSAVPLVLPPVALHIEMVRALGEAGIPVPGTAGRPSGTAPPGGGAAGLSRRVAGRTTIAAGLALLVGLGAWWLAEQQPGFDVPAAPITGEDEPTGPALPDDAGDAETDDLGPSGPASDAGAAGGTDDPADVGDDLPEADDGQGPASSDDGSATDDDVGNDADADDADGAGGGDSDGAGDDEPADLPVIAHLVVRSTAERCDRTGGVRHFVWWETSGADEVRLSTDAGHDEEVTPVGSSYELCVPRGSTVTLTATNEAGSVTRSETAA